MSFLTPERLHWGESSGLIGLFTLLMHLPHSPKDLIVLIKMKIDFSEFYNPK